MAFDDGVKTVSGSVAHTDDAATKVPFVSVKCGIEPTLTGKSEVVCTQTGRNLFDKTTATIGKYINVNGQEATNGIKAHSALLPLKPSTTYYMSGHADASYYTILALDKDMNVLSTWYGGASKTEPFVATTPNNAKWCYLNFNADQIDNVIFAESTTAIPYEPYNGTTYTVNLGRTIYGGSADIINGVGSNGYALFTKNTADMNNSESYPGWKNQGVRAICGGGLNQEYADGVTSSGNGYGINTLGSSNDILYLPKSMHDNMTQTDWIALAIDITFVIPLATPTDFTFTPITPTPETVGKVNNVYCNTGNTEVTYYDNAHGFSEVTVNKTGKNLIDGTKFTRGLPSTTIGASIDTITTSNRYAYYGVRAGGSVLTVSSTSSDADYFDYVLIFGYKNGILTYYSNAQTGASKTVDFTNCDYVRIGIGSKSGAITVPTDLTGYGTIQLELGSQASSYEPYEAVSKTAYLHKVIYDGQADVVKGTCEPKNLIHVPYYASSGSVSGGITYTYDNMGRVTCNGENTGTGNSVFYLERGVYIQNYPSGTYYFSQEGFPYQSGTASTVQLTICSKLDSTVTQRIQLYSNTTGKSFTVSDNEYINDIFIRIASGKSADFTVNIQLEKGGTGTDFSPYFTPFTFPPISIGTDEGENTLFANEGASAITYRKETD